MPVSTIQNPRTSSPTIPRSFFTSFRRISRFPRTSLRCGIPRTKSVRRKNQSTASVTCSWFTFRINPAATSATARIHSRVLPRMLCILENACVMPSKDDFVDGDSQPLMGVMFNLFALALSVSWVPPLPIFTPSKPAIDF